MITAVLILLGFEWLRSTIHNWVTEGSPEPNYASAAALIVLLWSSCLPLAIITLSLSVLLTIIAVIKKLNK